MPTLVSQPPSEPRLRKETIVFPVFDPILFCLDLTTSTDMLDQAHLPIQSAYIRKYAQILSIETYAQDVGITHTAHCQRCRKSTGSLEDIGSKDKKMWWCRRCRLAARICAIW